jgi:uncharacterized protein (TIGR02265 family)
LSSNNQTIRGNVLQKIIDGIGVSDDVFLLRKLFDQYGYDQKRPPINLEYQTFQDILEILRKTCYADKSYEDGYEALGYGFIQGFAKTPVGQVTKITSAMLGPQRGAHLLVKNAENTFPFGKHELEEVREGYFRYHYRRIPGSPGLLRGIFKAALEFSNLKDLRLTSRVLGANEAIIEVTWK